MKIKKSLRKSEIFWKEMDTFGNIFESQSTLLLIFWKMVENSMVTRAEGPRGVPGGYPPRVARRAIRPEGPVGPRRGPK